MLNDVNDLQPLFDKFFNFLAQEEFEQGILWSEQTLKLKCVDIFESINAKLLDDDFNLEHIPESADEEVNFISFSLVYFKARFLVEETYSYYQAELLIRLGVQILERLPKCFFNESLQAFATIQIDICNIDRGIYSSQPALLAKAVTSISTHLKQVHYFKENHPQDAQYLFDRYLDNEFTCYKLYCEAIAIIVELESFRWQKPDVLQVKLQQKSARFEECLESLSAHGKSILSSDVASLWPSLDYFAEHRKETDGELFIKSGSVTLCYYAGLNHHYHKSFIESLDNDQKNSESTFLTLANMGAECPVQNMVSDVWSGLADYDFLNTYTWQLTPIKFSFRTETGNEELSFNVQLTYYSMGVFTLQLSADVQNLSVTALRHLTSLGTPFALDLKMLDYQGGMLLVNEFVEKQFALLCDNLKAELPISTETKHTQLLTFNTIENRFVLTRINCFSQKINGIEQPVLAKNIREHFAFPGVVLPQREISTALDDWCLRSLPTEQLNLNIDCYNRDEFIYCHQHEGVIGLLEQPSWVVDQAHEMMLTASVITNLFHVTNEFLGKRLRDNLSYEPHASQKKKLSAVQLKQRMTVLEQERKMLKYFSDDANWLLNLINAGSMVSYPDHARMMQKAFLQMGFEGLKKRCTDVIHKITRRQDTILSESNRIYTKLQNHKSKRLRQVISGAMALISVGALKDIFDIINDSKLGITISGGLQVSLVCLFSLLMIIFLINKNDSLDD